MASQHDASSGGTIPETDQTMLRAMVWQAVGRHVEQLRMEGVPAADMARMVDHAMGMLLSVPPDQLTTISLTSPTMMAAVVAGYGSVYGPLSEQQMNQLRAAADTRSTLGQGDAAASGGSLWGQPGFPGGGWMSGGRGGMTSSARFEGMPGTAGAPGSYAAYASQYSGMGFDAGTIAAFAAVKLDREAYNDLAKDFDRGRIVDSARSAKILGFSGQDEIREIAEVEDRRLMRALEAYVLANPEDRPAKADELRGVYKDATPEVRKQFDDVLRTLDGKHQGLVDGIALGETATDENLVKIRAASGEATVTNTHREVDVKDASVAATSEEQLAGALDVFGVEAPASEPAPDKAAEAGAKKDAATGEKPVDTAALVSRPKQMTLGNG